MALVKKKGGEVGGGWWAGSVLTLIKEEEKKKKRGRVRQTNQNPTGSREEESGKRGERRGGK